MKLKVDKILYQLDGLPIKDENGESVTLKKVICSALINSQSSDGLEKFKRGKLASTIWEAESEVDLTVDDLSLIKKLVGEVFGALIVYQVWDYLDNLN